MPGMMMELGTLRMMMELSCWADNEAGNIRDDDGAGPLDVFSEQWICKDSSSAWMNGTISCKREAGAGPYDTGNTSLSRGGTAVILSACVSREAGQQP